MTPRRLTAIALVVGLVAACAAPQPSATVATPPARTRPKPVADAPVRFTTSIDRDHPLVGVVWDVAAGRAVDWSVVRTRMAGARYVLLGEKHDDPDHHVLQARAVRALVDSGRHPAIAFEMIEDVDQPAVDAFLASHAGAPDAGDLGAAVGWEKSGWPPWETYRPIADVALAAHLPIVAANLPRATVRAAMMKGVSVLPAPIAALIARPLPEEHAAALKAELAESHCGHLPASMTDGMVLAQRARDAALATQLQDAAKTSGSSVLIAGAGHTRRDRGVPSYLDAESVSVAFVEVQHGVTDPPAYAAGLHATRLPFDYVLFTPRANDDDPCARFHGSW